MRAFILRMKSSILLSNELILYLLQIVFSFLFRAKYNHDKKKGTINFNNF